MTTPEDISFKVLEMFDEMDRETLDLHELFEAGGNDPDARLAVFHAVENLVGRGLLEERGNDFYSLTDAGRRMLAEGKGGASSESRGHL